jgi:hypothetical protein
MRSGEPLPVGPAAGRQPASLAATGGEASSAASHPALDAPSVDAADADALDVPLEVARRTGVVFVHGIGTQGANETFLDWADPIVALLTDWRTAKAHGDGSGSERIDDPVWTAGFAIGGSRAPSLELIVPAHAGLPETSWVMTEAWWAGALRPPSLGRTIDYLSKRMATVVSGIGAGYRRRSHALHDLAVTVDLMGAGKEPLDWRVIERIDALQARTFGARPVGWCVAAVGLAALAGYDLLRRVPIGAVRDFAAARMIDSFIVDWFGDLPVLIDDPVQSANVRAHLARSIQGLLDDGCDAIVVVAHSGGALVSFEFLLDPAYAHLPVDKLITLGQGLGLAWRLAAEPKVAEINDGHRLVGNLARARPGLRWIDVWATYDPAPAGPLPARGGITPGDSDDVRPTDAATVVATADPASDGWLLQSDVGGTDPDPVAPTITVESRPVTNEMNVLTDHGGYWANPEGFLVPLVRHIDAARGPAAASRFYRDRTDRARRILWRRQRVGTLAAWGWLSGLVIGATVITLILLQAAGDERLTRAGEHIANAFESLPGSELISAPIGAVTGAVGAVLGALGLDGLVTWLASLGPPLLAILLLLGLAAALRRTATGRWHAWDARERVSMHPEVPHLPDRSGAASEALLLVGGLAGLVAAVFGAALVAALVIVLAAAAGLVVRVAKPSGRTARNPRPDAVA